MDSPRGNAGAFGDLQNGHRAAGAQFTPRQPGGHRRALSKSIIDQASNDADYTVITRRDASDAVVMSLDTFNSLMETVHLLKSPANATHLARSIEQYRKGKLKARNLADA